MAPFTLSTSILGVAACASTAIEAVINKPINNRMRMIFSIINLLGRCIDYIVIIVLLQMKWGIFINLKWLTSGDSEKRMERFADFEVVQKKLDIDRILKFGSMPDDIKENAFSIHDEEFRRIKGKYNIKKIKDLYAWSGKSIGQMAKDVSLEGDYHMVYGQISVLEHSGPSSVRKYLDDSQKGKTLVKIGPRDKDIDQVLLTSLQYFFGVKEITHNICDLEWPELENHKQTFERLRNKYWVKDQNL